MGIAECFYFLNNSFEGKYYQSRRVRRNGEWLHKDMIVCPQCKERKNKRSFVFLKVAGTDSRICKVCYNKEIERQRLDLLSHRAKQSADMIASFSDLLNECTKLGTCDILTAHHELLKNDPEHLTSDFMIGLVCGEEGLKKYQAKV
jgi:hypothetical protein